MKKATIDQLGWLERGNGKTQSNVVYSVGGRAVCLRRLWSKILDLHNR